MELKDLVGLHELSGVDMNNEKVKSEWGDDFEDCMVINFVLDGITYTAIEDPSDGYRSAMREIKRSDVVVQNTFAPQKVFCTMRNNKDDEVLGCYDVRTGKVVLSVGTDDYDDYYPCFVAEFHPENMAINQGRSA